MLSTLKIHLKKATSVFKNRFLRTLGYLDKMPVRQIILFAITINFILEILSQRSFIKGFGSLIDNPIMFVYNTLIILLTLSIGIFFSRKNFMFLLVFIMWMWLGSTNFLLLGFRTTPLTATDFHIFRSVFGIIHVYLNNFQLGLISILVAFIAVGVAIAFKKLPKNRVYFKNSFITLATILVLLLSVSDISVRAKAVSKDYGNLAEAFKNYGFAYCFTASILDQGISKPKTYSPETVEVVLQTIDTSEVVKEVDSNLRIPSTPSQSVKNTLKQLALNNAEDKAPNVVIIQLESFFDVKHLINYTYSSDPIPNFTKLKRQFSSGFLTVPSIGAGTANTEFEVLTGMSLDFFGAGEYPYKTVLKDTTVESIAYDLGEIGYKSHAIHNNTGTFYSRNKVYPNLGFDSFSSIEYMNDLEYNPLGWAKDKVITTEVLKALKSTDESDFIFAVSVQPHGKYPDVVVDETQSIKMFGLQEEADIIGYEYFLNQMHETDAFIGELLSELSNFEEPVVVVFYGDHLPSMNIEDIDLDNGNKFQTEYIMWSNFSMKKVDKDLSSYQLSAQIMERLGYDNGIITKFHQNSSQLDNYQDELLLLQYDMLYGDMNAYNGSNPHLKKDMTMGTSKVIITDVSQRGETIFVRGINFTEWSDVYINGSKKDTLYVDKNTLVIPHETLDDVQTVYVAQVTDSDKVLSKSDQWLAPGVIVDEPEAN